MLCLTLVAGDAFAQGRGGGRDGRGGRDGGGGGGGGEQRGGGGGGAQRGGGDGQRGGGGDQSRGRSSGSQQRGRSEGNIRRGGDGGNRGGRAPAATNRPNPSSRPEGNIRRNDGGRPTGDAQPRVRDESRNAEPRTAQPRVRDESRAADRQERRTNRPDFDQNLGDRDGRNRDLTRDRDLRDRDARNRIGDGDLRDRRGDRDLRDRVGDRDLRDRQGGDRDGNRFGNRGDGRRGDRNWDRDGDRNWDDDWDRDGRGRDGWANSGWNGRWGRRHDGWRRGYWNWNSYGYRPWWGGYGGFGRTGLGVSLLGLGLGYNTWGVGGYGYPYGYAYGNNWGYGGWLNSGYFYNPYNSEPLVIGSTVVDYSQPLVTVDAIETSATVTDDVADADPNTLAAMADLDAARISFRAGDYNAALDQVHRAIERLPNDPALHEFRALVLFAQGNYRDAAATLHAVLASGPGWDWATMRDLYPDIDTYTVQLRALEDFARVNQDSADAQFVLGYHYLTEGYQDAGIARFQRVVELQPKDLLAVRIVESAVPDAATTSLEGAVEEPPQAPVEAAAAGGATLNLDQLRGDWQATQDDGSSFTLSLAADDTFTWKFAQGDQSNSLQGNYSVSNDLLILEPESGTPMVARISETGSDGFRFKMAGTPEEDDGLKFSK